MAAAEADGTLCHTCRASHLRLDLIGNLLYVDPRPFVVGHFIPLIPHVPDNGFPSDHTLLAAALAAIGMYWNKWLGLALWVIAIAIAIARVYVGLHHPIDVLGSIVFALIADFDLASSHYICMGTWHGRLKHRGIVATCKC